MQTQRRPVPGWLTSSPWIIQLLETILGCSSDLLLPESFINTNRRSAPVGVEQALRHRIHFRAGHLASRPTPPNSGKLNRRIPPHR